jgi:ABC-type molybdate transport system substrate-binding protein
MATATQAAEVTVFAAASLKNALDDAAKAYEAFDTLIRAV